MSIWSVLMKNIKLIKYTPLSQPKHLNKIFDTVSVRLKHHDWSYEGECGPQTWSKTFPGARGHHQSPINVETNSTRYDEKLALNPLVIDYDHHSCSQIRNTGHTFQVDGYKSNLSTVSGGPVKHRYSFLQFHMHWGDSLERGSEHLIDGKPYSAEIHFVNWNHELYKTPKAASSSNKNDGVLVLGVFIKTGKHNAEFEKIVQLINDIHLKDHHVPVHNIYMNRLMPENISDYWSYQGSLTTPPCSECVTWVIFKDHIEISPHQLDMCHHLYSVKKEKLCNEKTSIRYNDRPVCSMYDRVVTRSFLK